MSLQGGHEKMRRNRGSSGVQETEETAMKLRKKCSCKAPSAPLEWRPHSCCRFNFPVPSPRPL
jgi:hypothetical protein